MVECRKWYTYRERERPWLLSEHICILPPTKPPLSGLQNPNLCDSLQSNCGPFTTPKTFPSSTAIRLTLTTTAYRQPPSSLPVDRPRQDKMSGPALNKIAHNSPSRANPSELEQSIAQALYDLESNTADLKVALRPLQIVSAREVRIT